MRVAEVLSRFSLTESDVSFWIEQRWIAPAQDESGWVFDDTDQARLALIVELRQGLAVNDDAMPVVLSLLDQLYAARNTLRHVRDALAKLPDPALDDILAKIEVELDKS